MTLYTYFRSSCAWRVRIGLALKGLAATPHFVHLLKDGGQQRQPEYAALNPQKIVPALVLDDSQVLTQSLAILEYLEETHPRPSFLPVDPVARAHCRAFALAIACEIHPINNLRTQQRLTQQFGADEAQKKAWMHFWFEENFAALEELAKRHGSGPFLFGDTPGLAEICLVPQLFNARRFAFPLDAYPRLVAAEQACLALPAFADTAPGKQGDAE